MRRREFIAGFCIATALPARAQQTTSKMRRVGFLTRETDASVSTQIDAFRQRLGELGWVEGKTINIVYRDASGQLDRLATLAHGLWICIKALLHGFEQMLMLPSWNPPLWPCVHCDLSEQS